MDLDPKGTRIKRWFASGLPGVLGAGDRHLSRLPHGQHDVIDTAIAAADLAPTPASVTVVSDVAIRDAKALVAVAVTAISTTGRRSATDPTSN